MREMLQPLVERHGQRVRDLRWTIHKNPELSYQEEKTAGLVAGVLEELGLQVRRGVGGHGVVGLLEGGHPGPCVALRADIDALPMEEKTGLPQASTVKGVMHACGHDAHTAILLGAALVLADMRKDLRGSVKFIFQPAEEGNPKGGAPGMIADGVLENPRVDAIFGLHVWPALETGTIATKAGALMGASDRLFLTVTGRAAHGSEPENGVDGIAISAQVISALQTIVSRNVSPLDSAVVTIGTIRGGDRYNVIASEVVMEGTVRTVSPDVQDAMPSRIQRVAEGVARGMGGDCRVEYVKGYPPLMNDPGLAKTASTALEKVFGTDRVLRVEKPALGGEDFSFFCREVPGLFLWLGTRPASVPKEEMPPLHNPRFAADEASLPLGMKALVSCVLEYLGS